MTGKQISDLGGIQSLAFSILNAARKKPACVITIPFHKEAPAFDLSELSEAGDVCDFYVIETSELTREFAALMPENTGVFNGAVKVYPIGFSADDDPFSLPIFYPRADSQRSVDSLLNEIWARADVSSLKSQQLSRSIPASGEIIRFFDARAMVKLEGNVLATIRQEISFPGVPLEWIFKIGDKVSGSFDQLDGAFIPDSSDRTIKDVASAYGLGSVVLALVSEIGRQTGKLRLLPNVEVEIKREEISHNERDLVEDFMDVGDVVCVRLYRHDQGAIRVRMDDIDDDEVVLHALPLVEGGMPWLVEGRDVPGRIAEVDPNNLDQEPIEYAPVEVEQGEPVALTGGMPLPGPGRLPGMSVPSAVETPGGNEVAMAKFAAKQYLESLKQANARLLTATNQANDFKQRWIDAARDRDTYIEQLRKSNKTVKKGKLHEVREENQKRSDTLSRRDRWDNDIDWFNEELRRSWISRYTPSERKGEYKLNFDNFIYSGHFFDSLRELSLDEESLRKVTRVILDIVTGRENRERRYALHPLEEGSNPMVRADGAECFRAYLEQSTPQAKRLHFWKLGNSRFEISRVVKHDDYRP